MYYTRNGEYYDVECPLCGATFIMPYGPVKQTDVRKMTPVSDTTCPGCGHLSMRPGDAMEYRSPAEFAGGGAG